MFRAGFFEENQKKKKSETDPKKKLRQGKKKNGSQGGGMTSDDKKTTKTYVREPILVGERKLFFSFAPYFSRSVENDQNPKKKTKTNFTRYGLIN